MNFVMQLINDGWKLKYTHDEPECTVIFSKGVAKLIFTSTGETKNEALNNCIQLLEDEFNQKQDESCNPMKLFIDLENSLNYKFKNPLWAFYLFPTAIEDYQKYGKFASIGYKLSMRPENANLSRSVQKLLWRSSDHTFVFATVGAIVLDIENREIYFFFAFFEKCEFLFH